MAAPWPDRFGEPPLACGAGSGAWPLPLVRPLPIAAATLAAAVRCPNPLVRLALAAHDDLGYRRAAVLTGTTEDPCPIPEPFPPAAASSRT